MYVLVAEKFTSLVDGCLPIVVTNSAPTDEVFMNLTLEELIRLIEDNPDAFEN